MPTQTAQEHAASKSRHDDISTYRHVEEKCRPETAPLTRNRMKMKIKRHIAMLLTASLMVIGCSKNDGDSSQPAPQEDLEIRFNPDVWHVLEGSRATTYDDQAAIQEEGSFICSAYNTGTTTVNTTSNVNGITATWNGSTAWEFAEKHYWPLTDALDFFAYMPASPDDYITEVVYAVDGDDAPAPYFTCDMTETVDKEFIWALATEQDREHQGASGVTMTFEHPFARIYFKLSDDSGTAVTVNSITISGSDFYKTGTCTFDGTTSDWSSLGGAGFLGTLALNTPYLVIPSDYGSSKTITVNATWDEWSSFTTDVTSSALSINWQAGYSYTYTLYLTKYALKVDVDKYTEQW